MKVGRLKQPMLAVRLQHTSAAAVRDSQREFILSILQANPSARDSRSYLQAFAPPQFVQAPKLKAVIHPTPPVPNELSPKPKKTAAEMSAMAQSIVEPIRQHTGLVKIQGPFTDRQLTSIAEGMVYLRRLGLVSILVIDRDDYDPADPTARAVMSDEVYRLADLIEAAGGLSRPMLEPILRHSVGGLEIDNVSGLQAAISCGEIPVLPPFALDKISQSSCVKANAIMLGLAKSLSSQPSTSTSRIDLTPVRLMVINQEGGIPSHARGGTPHLSINLESEFQYIHDTYVWQSSHPTSLSNLNLMKACLQVLPRTSSGVIVSHRSPKALIANLVTNKPAHSPSLHLSAFPSSTRLQHTPTILRHGLPIKVHNSLHGINLSSLTKLLELSFGQKLDQETYYSRLEQVLDFAIVAGDQECAAVAIVTREGPNRDVSYLDKFAVLPSLQGDGTVDFLWGALRDETFGLGLLDALNNNGGLEGRGEGVDLVWRSRADNPVNRWYFERSNGFATLKEMGKGGVPGTLFWCDAEKRLEDQQKLEAEHIPFITDQERGRLEHWLDVIGRVPSCWLRKS